MDPKDLDVIVSNIGITPDFSAIYTSNSGQHTAFVQASLKEGHRTGSYAYMDRVRRRVRAELPELSTYFQSGGLVDAVLNSGLPAPIDIQISGSKLGRSYKVAQDLAAQIRKLPGVSDVLIPQDVDYPAIKLEVDRERAAELGLTSKEVMDNVVTAVNSDGMIAPSFWVDPHSGNEYMVTVQYPENEVKDAGATWVVEGHTAAIRGPKSWKDSTRLDSVVSIRQMDSPTEVDHYQLGRVIDVYVAHARLRI